MANVTTQRLVSFWVGEQIYAVPLLLVGEFGPTIQITPVDAVDERIEGIAHLRETSAVVISMRKILKATGGGQHVEDDMIYIVPHDQLCDEAKKQNLSSFIEPIVLHVDRLANIINVNPNDMHPTPSHLVEPFYQGVFEIDGRDLILLDFSKLIDCLLTQLNENPR